jgi:SagB-type dehydrogenase family enzyme
VVTAEEYLRAIMARNRKFMQPLGYQPDWADHPRRQKFYPGIECLPLPGGTDDDGASLYDGMYGGPDASTGQFTLARLGSMLRDSYGQLGRRLTPNANSDVPNLPRYAESKWGRGTASGGGLYPVSVYWVAGRSAPVLPGVYYYNPAQHGMQRLLTGDVSAEVRDAVADPTIAEGTDQFLVLGLKWWQNSFKYNSFTFHAVTMDIGTVTQTWRMWAQAHGIELAVRLWFDERRLGRLLSAIPEQEGILAAVPLPWRPADTGAWASASWQPRIGYTESERSRRTRTFETVVSVHEATMAGAMDRPAPSALKAAAASGPRALGPVVALPDPQPLTGTLSAALRARRSSFGRFSSAQPMSPAHLSAVLAAASQAAAYPCDANADGLTLAKSFVFVNHVRGIAAGAHEYEPVTNTLHPVADGVRGDFLQRNYFLENYNVEQAAAVIVIAVRALAVLDAVGERGYRLTNAVVGAVSQAVYTACAALGVGCGAALGFDNLSYVEELDTADTGEAPLLIIMVGNERPQAANFRSEIV